MHIREDFLDKGSELGRWWEMVVARSWNRKEVPCSA